MKPSLVPRTHRDDVRRIVLVHRATNPRVFGSAARGEDTATSDLDLLIDPTPQMTLLDLGAIRHELLQVLGVPVDVVTPKSLPVAFRDRVLADALPL